MPIDMAEAATLLEQAAQTDPTIPGYEGGAQSGGQEQVETQPTQGNDSQDGAAGNADTFTQVNPDNLPEELKPYWQQLQADYTRKTQQIAEQRKAYEAFGETDPTQALEALQFVQALQSDPNVAQQVHAELTQALMAAGLSPSQAFATASNQMQGNQDQPQLQPQDPNVWSEDELEFGTDPQVMQKLNQFEQFMQSYENDRAEQQRMFEIQRQDSAIRHAHPEYTDQDMKRIYELSSWHGDLFSAEKEWASIRSDIVAGFLNDKKNVPAAGPRGGGGSAQVPPEGFHTLDDPNLDKAVMEYLRNVEANE